MAPVSIPIHLRWADMDLYGHVNNAVYVRYMEQARVELLAGVGFEPTIEGHGQLVARNEVDYLTPLTYQLEPIEMLVGIEHIGNTSYTFSYELRDGEVVYLRAKTRMVSFDLETQRPGRIPTPLRDFLLSVQAD